MPGHQGKYTLKSFLLGCIYFHSSPYNKWSSMETGKYLEHMKTEMQMNRLSLLFKNTQNAEKN